MEFFIELLAEQLSVSPDLLHKSLSVVGFLVSLLFPLFGAYLVLHRYLIKRFSDQITYSGNQLVQEEDGSITLALRNPLMLPKSDILPLNWMFNVRLAIAIWHCSPKDPFIRMSQRDMDVLQPSIINAYSALFADRITSRLFGEGEVEKELLMAVTFEKDGSLRNQKIRVMIISKETLVHFSDPDFVDTLNYERSHHRYRTHTLRKMYETYEAEKELSNDSVKIIRQIYV